VTGIVGGSFIQIVPQLFEAVSVIIVAFGLSYVFFSALKRAGLLRTRAEDEVAGLDLSEMGEHGYVADDVAVPGGQVGAVPAPLGGVTAPAN
jgi:ammonia channel protein AmtB